VIGHTECWPPSRCLRRYMDMEFGSRRVSSRTAPDYRHCQNSSIHTSGCSGLWNEFPEWGSPVRQTFSGRGLHATQKHVAHVSDAQHF